MEFFDKIIHKFNEIPSWLQWTIVVFIAGFIGQFGKSLSKKIISLLDLNNYRKKVSQSNNIKTNKNNILSEKDLKKIAKEKSKAIKKLNKNKSKLIKKKSEN